MVRSVLGGEAYALADCFSIAYALHDDMNDIMGYDVPITMLTDSESLFKFIVRSKTTERMLMIDVKAAREAFERIEISNMGWIRSDENIADGLTKTGNCKTLEDLINTGILSIEVEQWIGRNDTVLKKSE